MYSPFKEKVMSLLKVPPEPENPAGEQGSLKVFRAAPGFFRYRWIFWMIGTAFSLMVYLVLFVILLVGGFTAGALAPLCWLGALALLIFVVTQVYFSYAIMRLDYELRWYKVTDRSLRIREGVLLVREMTMTFANIQNISITQGPLERYFNIANLKVETAGGGGAADPNHQEAFNLHTGYFRGVDNAEEIRDLMLERLRKYRTDGLGDIEEPAGEAVTDAAATPADSVEGDVLIQLLKDIRFEAHRFHQVAVRKFHS